LAREPQSTAVRLGLYDAVLGSVLGGYVVFHAWQQWPAVISRDAWLERAQHAALPSALKLVVYAAIVGHMLLSVMRLRLGAHPADDSAAAGLRRVQLFFGALVFLAIHIPMVHWTPGPASTVLDVYARLTEQVGRPPMLAAYLVGTTAVCAHLGLGLSRAAVSLGVAKSPSGWIYLTGLLAAAVLLCFLQVLACYAMGEPLVPFGVPTSAP
jgi:succinate dehydrogenase/fumarate reductase cytochrome b subunit